MSKSREDGALSYGDGNFGVDRLERNPEKRRGSGGGRGEGGRRPVVR